MTDPIADYLTRVRNASMAGHRIVDIPASKMKLELTRILHDSGYILSYKLVEGEPYNTIKIALKYNSGTGKSAIKKIARVSRPGLRKYVKATELPRILNGLGIAVISTSQGLMTDKQARTQNIGGEVVCYLY